MSTSHSDEKFSRKKISFSLKKNKKTTKHKNKKNKHLKPHEEAVTRGATCCPSPVPGRERDAADQSSTLARFHKQPDCLSVSRWACQSAVPYIKNSLRRRTAMLHWVAKIPVPFPPPRQESLKGRSLKSVCAGGARGRGHRNS